MTGHHTTPGVRYGADSVGGVLGLARISARKTAIVGLRRVRTQLRAFERESRPEPPALAEALRRRRESYPSWASSAAQSIGARTMGCEGTHGVFPKCNLACTPCYHSADANRVRIDGDHTRAEVDSQTAYHAERRGPGQYSQLIGGEVTLLAPDEHAAALEAMIANGRKPMSMSHGDFDADYLRKLALDGDGKPRFARIFFALHFDKLMRGRTGAERPERESDLHRHRAEACAMFRRLSEETGMRCYLAHNMTVTPANVDEIPDLIQSCGQMGFRMFSFQPAAFQGNQARWKEDYSRLPSDEVWSKIEEGAGARLPYRLIQTGDLRCNRTAYGAYVGKRWVPLFDDRDPRDHGLRDAFFGAMGAMNTEVGPVLAGTRIVRGIAREPRVLPIGLAWATRFARRAGVRQLVRRGAKSMTFVMHSFMDAADVLPAWRLLERGQMSEEQQVRETQERLLACAYHMAHPETGRLIPACAQHAVYDPAENMRLAKLLPARSSGASTSRAQEPHDLVDLGVAGPHQEGAEPSV